MQIFVLMRGGLYFKAFSTLELAQDFVHKFDGEIYEWSNEFELYYYAPNQVDSDKEDFLWHIYNDKVDAEILFFRLMSMYQAGATD